MDPKGLIIDGEVDDVAELLLACQGLKFLAISASGYPTCNSWIVRLIRSYQRGCQQRGLGPLGLHSLYLGVGCLCFEPESVEECAPPEPEILSLLTDTSKLQHLRLDNERYSDSTATHPTWRVGADYLQHTTSLQRLVVERFSDDILQFVQRMNVLGRNSVLASLEVSRYFSGLADPTRSPLSESDELNELWPCHEVFSENLDQSGYHWKHLSIGATAQSEELGASEADHPLQDYIPRCHDLETLSFPLTDSHIVCYLLP